MPKKKLPAEIKRIRGTYQPCRDNLPKLPDNSLDRLPDPPEYLTGEGLIYYQQQGTQYLKLGVLNAYHLPLFVMACLYITRLSEYARQLNKNKDLDLTVKYQRLFNDSEKNLRLSLAELGLSPASWHKVAKEIKKEPTEFEKFFNNNREVKK